MLEDIVSFDGYDQGSADCLLLGPATFLRDFGPWERGQKVKNLILHYVLGYLIELDAKGNTRKQCPVRLKAMK